MFDHEREVPARSRMLVAFLAAAPVLIAAILGSLATEPNIKTYYAGLAKPWFTPSTWLFGPAWTTLYILMAYAFWRILNLPAGTPGRNGAIAAFIIQVLLNALWPIAFFAWHAHGVSMVVMVALWAAILVTILRFRPLDRIAALCLAPYLAWTTYAAALNAGFWWLNR